MRQLDAGEDLFQEGDLGTKLYLLLEGSLTLKKRQPGRESRIVEQIKAGEFVGESALLDYPPRPVTATAATGCRLLELPGAFLGDLITTRPQEARRLIESLARRLNSSLLSEAAPSSPAPRATDACGQPAGSQESSASRSAAAGDDAAQATKESPSVDWQALAEALTHDQELPAPLAVNAVETALLTPLPPTEESLTMTRSALQPPGSLTQILRPDAVAAQPRGESAHSISKHSWWSSPAALITMAALVTVLAIVGLWVLSNSPG